MKKIYFSNYDSLNNPYYGGGGAVAVHEVAKRLVKDFSVTVVTGKYPGSKNEIIDGVNYKRIGIASLPPKFAQLTFQIILPWYSLTQKYDIWVESFTPPYSTSFLPLLTSKPVVGLTHLLGGEEMSKKYKLPFYTLEKFGLKFYKHCIVLTEALREKVLKINHKIQTIVIPNGIDPEFLKESSFPEGKSLLFLGRLDVHQKGLDVLLDAYKRIKDKVNIPLILAGTGTPSDEAWLKQRIEELNLKDLVQMPGKVVGEAKKKLYREAMLFVMPSRDENFPLTVLESSCFGLPLIASNIIGFSWVPDVCADKVPKENPEELAQAILHLFSSPEQRKIMGVAAKEFVKKYNWDDITQRYKNYLNQL